PGTPRHRTQPQHTNATYPQFLTNFYDNLKRRLVKRPEKAAPCGIQACESPETLKRKAAFLMTECKPKPIEFHALGAREVMAYFDGGDITSDGGGLILREVEQRTGILKKFAACFVDYRDPEAIEHLVEDLVAQRAYGLCLGYEDLNDYDELRADPLL